MNCQVRKSKSLNELVETIQKAQKCSECTGQGDLIFQDILT
ncbi:hypothetical protein [Methanobrevibacter sp.]|nr:hypothetical protein [Methanobrevibacter sp.]MEE0939158.1 hypothetical protein [Methanobrevibacter sp.]